MKKLITLILSLLMTVVFLACGGGDTDGSKKAASKPAGTQEKTASIATGYQATTVTNGGSIAGKVTLAGAVPAKKKLEITKDTNVCGKIAHYDESVVVSANNGLANVVVKLTNINQGKSLDAMGTSFTLDQNGCAFLPHLILLPVETEVTIINSDGILHNIHTYCEDNDPVNIAQPGFKKQVKLSFTEPEAVRIACDVHSWMGGHVIVVDNPYNAITDADGNFELTDVPAGTYTVEFWQETLGTQTQEITVEAGGTAQANAEFAVGS